MVKTTGTLHAHVEFETFGGLDARLKGGQNPFQLGRAGFVALRMLPCQMLPLIFVVLRVLVGFRSRREVALENLVLRHQLQVALRTNPTPRLRNPDRILWIWLRRLWPSWDAHLLVVKPETVIRWHRMGWRLYWSWKPTAAS